MNSPEIKSEQNKDVEYVNSKKLWTPEKSLNMKKLWKNSSKL